ncbi:MAG TPA: hypothetical protein VMH35_28235 [Streptosporangiaceae bacterium]|nr:hypothetical protein [Streptosporangiaceae bacterium]
MAGDGRAELGGSPLTVETRMVVEYGITLDGVWLPLALLRRLEGHGPWSAPFTEATTDQERVLVRHGLAEQHNRAGLHRGNGLPGFLAAVPFEPTAPLEKLGQRENGGRGAPPGSEPPRG